MKKFFVIAMALCLMAPLSMAQVNDGNYQQPEKMAFNTTRGLGDVNWTLDMETPTGDNRLLGVEFDGTNYWATGAMDFSIANLYEIAPDGTLVNTYAQPTGNWGGWGWRDIAFDGTYLYCGNPNVGTIEQIDPGTGSVTGTTYGTFPVVPCRALAYVDAEDCFWTASFTSSLYKCFKDGTSQTFSNPGLSMYGAASSPSGIWWWSQDGNGSLGSLMGFDGTFTGDTFDGDLSMGGGIAGGAGAYDLGGSNWEFVGMHQGTPDYAAGYDINMTHDALEVLPSEVSAYFGGTVNFSLYGGVDNANRNYVLVGTFSGTAPGTNLPGGLILPINWDWFTDFTIMMALNGGLGLVNDFIGTLDADGNATASLVFPGHCQLYQDVTANFAYTLRPYDFVSNAVEVLVTGAPPPPDEYSYDDASAENLLGYGTGGDMAWVNWFETIPGMETITEAGSGFGSTTYPGYGPGNGTPATLYVWDAAGGSVTNYGFDDSPAGPYGQMATGDNAAAIYAGTGLDLTGPNPTLTLKYTGDFEGTTSTWDGLIVEVSDDGTTWTQVDAANLQGNYDAILSSSFGNPFGGLYAFCYDVVDREVTWDLSDFNTYTNATFRFNFGWDTWDTTDEGCIVDNWTVADDNGVIYDDDCSDATDYVMENTWDVVLLSSAGGGANDLTAGVLLDTVSVLTANYDLDVVNWYSLTAPISLGQAFFVGGMISSAPGQYVYPMDESSNPTNGEAWLLGSLSTTGPLDPTNPGINDDCEPMNSIGFDCYAIVRAR